MKQAVLILCLLLLAGCQSRGAQLPPDPDPTPAPAIDTPPPAPAAERKVSDIVAGSGYRSEHGQWNEHWEVAEGRVWVNFVFRPDTTVDESAARGALRVTGDQPVVDWGAMVDNSGYILGLTWDQGPPGTGATVELVGFAAPDGRPARFSFVRAATPRVSLSVRTAGGWQPLHERNQLPPLDPLELRFQFSKPMDQTPEALWGWTAGGSSLDGGFTWTTSQELWWRIDQPPRWISISLREVRDVDGHHVEEQRPWLLLIGGEPYLAAIDPATGREERLGPAPTDLESAVLAPDGRSVLASRWSFDRYPPDLRRIALTLTGVESDLPPAEPRTDFPGFTLSPDRRLAADLIATGDTSGRVPMALHDIEVVETATSERRTLKTDIPRWGFNIGTERDISLHLAWSPDSRQIAVLNARVSHNQGVDLVAFDVATGARSVLARDLPLSALGARLCWSPDGSRITAGNLLVELSTGAVTTPGGCLWDKGSRYTVSGSPWGPIRIYDTATARTIDAGAGLSTGFLPDGRLLVIRWANSDARYVVPGP